MSDLGFKHSAIDHSVFYRRSEQEHTIVAVATDDMGITSKCTEDIVKFKSELKRHWDITDMGQIQWFLGLRSSTIELHKQY